MLPSFLRNASITVRIAEVKQLWRKIIKFSGNQLRHARYVSLS